jgi:hypothetical protein
MWVEITSSSRTGGDLMTRITIHGGEVDVLCACGNPEYLPSSLKYGFRLNFFCIGCDAEFALDVIE